MTTKLLRRTALGVAGLAVITVISVALVATAGAHDVSIPEMPIPPHKHYGAIAYAPNGAWGKALHARTPSRAEIAALQQCGLDSCQVLSSFTRCGAVAFDGSRFQGGTGFTRPEAEQEAMKDLGGGWIVNWACNFP
ncbi:DUF4189 domain-containing protein [Mycobacterium gastri]|uniref:DUF4189 domain-containing protein n=1 Tax=Mycobacterium gastri TaxID=1777 RepID=UPI0004B63F35|nr:DUF4189 domain-containing protein [Mycobacterium gastri]